MNICKLTDSYKASHHKLWPPGTQTVYSYLESRGGRWPETVFFGLQYILREYLEDRVVDAVDVRIAEKLYRTHFGTDLFNVDGWMHIVKDHSGMLPLSIKAVPEGTVVPNHNVLMTVENTCPQCFWLTNYVESLLVQLWYPITVATQSREIKKIIWRFLHETGDPSLIDFKLHDFGFRGVSSVESAGIGAAAHLVNFKGTDTIRGVEMLSQHYDEPCAGFSIPASEHSTITSWGRENEVDAFRNMLEQYPTGLVACVSDSYDIFRACTDLWGSQLKDRVLERDGCLVVRPDSGDPRATVLAVLGRLADAFGYEVNSKHYHVLNPKVRVIQGDGVNAESIYDILSAMQGMGYSADNIAFGMGGALLQKLDRDTQKMAFKCSYVNGCYGHGFWERDVYKEPITDAGKNSKRGRLKLVRNLNGLVGSAYATVRQEECPQQPNELVEVFRDGRLLVKQTLADIRQRAAL